MRVILDTNVILSAIFFGGIPGQILEAYRDGQLALVLSPDILDDDKFIACALASGAKIICSGDKHLLDIDGHQGIEVLKPRNFVDQYL